MGFLVALLNLSDCLHHPTKYQEAHLLLWNALAPCASNHGSNILFELPASLNPKVTSDVSGSVTNQVVTINHIQLLWLSLVMPWLSFFAQSTGTLWPSVSDLLLLRDVSKSMFNYLFIL